MLSDGAIKIAVCYPANTKAISFFDSDRFSFPWVTIVNYQIDNGSNRAIPQPIPTAAKVNYPLFWIKDTHII
jgi:hypothetical protein